MNENYAQVEMPRYKCHKEVHALKIKEILQSPSKQISEGGTWDIIPADKGFAKFSVAHDWYVKHEPKVGGYYIVYSDGYTSYSPESAFEAGYTPA